MRRSATSIVIATAALVTIAGCSSDSKKETTVATQAATTAASSATAGSASATTGSTTSTTSTTRAATATTAAASATTAAASSGAGTKVSFSVPDDKITGPTTLTAGTVEFTVTNTGRSAHEFVVIKGTYATLPKSTNGAVIETQLTAGALIGRTNRINAGASETKSFTLTAGQYVLLCNIVNGPASHAGNGQRLDVTVA